VRDYLAEGLLSPTDSARAEGAEHWIGVTDLLDKLASPSDTSRIPEAVHPADNDKPKRAPDAPPGVSHFPSKFSDSKELTTPMNIGSLSKKTIPIGPTAPRSLAPAPTSSSQTTTSPLVPPRQSTKKVTRASLVKQLVQRTAPLPTTKSLIPKSDPPPSAPPVAEAPAPAVVPIRAPAPEENDGTSPTPAQVKEANNTPIPSLIKALTAKTVPMRTNSAPPVTQKASPFTAPLPTKTMFKPATGKVAAPETPTEKLDKKIEKKSARIEVPESEPLPSPISKRLPAFGKKPSPKSGVSTTEKAASAVVMPDDDVKAPYEPPPTEKPKRRSRPIKPLPILVGVCAVLAIALGYYIWSPYHAIGLFRKALNEGDPGQLDATVDFASVRESLKGQIQTQLGSSGDNAGDAKSNPAVASTLDNSIELYLTPTVVAGLVKSDTSNLGDYSKALSPDAAAKILLQLSSEPVKKQGLMSLDDFAVDLDAAMLHFRLNGLAWKLKTIVLRPDLQASSPSSPNTPSLLVSPVVDTWLQRGNNLIKKSDWDNAVAAFTQVLSIYPKSSAAYSGRASALQSKGDLNSALNDYTQAVNLDPGSASAYNARGNVKAAKNDLDGAIADFSQAIHLDPTLATAFDSRGNARTAKDDLDGAIADYTEAITLDPKLASAYSDRGFARQANGNLDGAIADYTQALTLKPTTAFIYYNRGLARQSQGNLEAAIVDYDKALAFNPKIPEAFYYRGNAKNSLHDLDGAIADYTQAIALKPMALAYCNRGLAQQSKGNLDAAVADYTEALTIDPKIAIAYYNRGLIKEQRNDLDGAIADSTQALDLDPKNAQAYYNRGFAKLSKGNLDGALADLKEYCDLAPTDRYADHARLYLWLIAKAQNTKSDPDQDLSDALQSNWNSTGDDMATKAAAFLLGRLSEADFLASATSSDVKTDQGQHCEAWYFAGMKRLLMGDKLTAIDYFKKCLATGQSDYCEFILARAELQALQPITLPSPAAPPAPAVLPQPLPVVPPVAEPVAPVAKPA
jgi:tetratricopeptide (TPR) repeat protein